MKRYPIREPNRGKVVAYHVRHENPDGTKRFTWQGPDGTSGLGGLHTADLPLFGAAAAHRWLVDEPVIVTEGEKACAALVRAGYQAAGTVTGAAGCPNREPLMVLAGMQALLWPDADDAGRRHMQAVAANLGTPGDIVGHPVRWITWGTDGSDAADAVAAGIDIDQLIARAGSVPPPESAEPVNLAEARRKAGAPRWRRNLVRHESTIDAFNRAVTVSDVLSRDFGLAAVPGRAMRCGWHEDRNPSLSILPDDRRAFCHSPTCWANNDGRGRDAWDLAHAALELAR